MNFRTPFHICGGRVLDRDCRPVALYPSCELKFADKIKMEG